MPPLRTNLIDTYLELKAFINKHLPEKFYMEGDQRVDNPLRSGSSCVAFPISVNFPFLGQPAMRFENFAGDF